jgi:flagellar basal-body rod protein FlgC
MFESLDIGASALEAQRVRLDTIAGNVANINTTHDKSGKVHPYQRRFVVLASGNAGSGDAPGVHVEQIGTEDKAPLEKFDPGNPDADKNGYVAYPAIDLSTEMVDALEASRSYEANVTTMENAKAMINSTLRLLA